MVATPGALLNIGTGTKQNRFELQTAHIGDGAITTISVATLNGGFTDDTIFTNADGSGVVFAVQEGAPLTSVDAGGARSELREMALDGVTEMAFDATLNDNWIMGSSRVTAGPDGHLNGVVIAQMHDTSSDNIEICTQLSGGVIKLLCRINGTSVGMPVLNALYMTDINTPGPWVDWKIRVGSFGYKIYINDFTNPIIDSTTSGMPALTLSGLCYFKAGVYTQCKDTDIVDPNRYSKVELKNLKHWHTGWPDPTAKAAVGPITNVHVGTATTLQNSPAGSMNTVPALPTGVVDGDQLVIVDWIFHAQENHAQGTAQTPATPSGWQRKATNFAFTSLKTGTGASPYHAAMRLTWFYAKYDSTGLNGVSAAPTITVAGSQTDDFHSSQMISFSGAALGDPTDVLGAFTAVDATPVVLAAASATLMGPAAGVVTTRNGGIVIVAMACDYKLSSGSVPTLIGDGLTWVEMAEYGSGTGPTMSWGIDYALVPNAQTITDKSATVALAGTGKSIAQMWAIAATPASDPINRLRRRNRPLLVR